MKILTWNINGIRSIKKPLKRMFDELDADVICIQETKVTRDQLDEPTAVVEGYNGYFSFSKVRSGYSGVATFCKDSCTPYKAEEGLSGVKCWNNEEANVGCYGNHEDFNDEELHALDNEGRCVVTEHKIRNHNNEETLLTIINVYCPRADAEKPERLMFKLRFYELLQRRAETLLSSGSHVVIVGDVNTSHKPIDHCDPDHDPEFLNQPGRKWLSQFLWDPSGNHGNQDNTAAIDGNQLGGMFVDTFRYFHPDEKNAFTCWSTVTGARQTNYGTRIDYIFADQKLAERMFQDCIIQPDIEGSDHCPVKATLNCDVVPASKCPPFCTKYLPEFGGKQQKLSSFFTKSQKSKSNVKFTDMNTMTGAQKIGLKRPPENNGNNNKKTKLADKKQTSLMNFFSKPKVVKILPEDTITVTGSCENMSESTTDLTRLENISVPSVVVSDVDTSKGVTVSSPVEVDIPEGGDNSKSVSQQWKSVLKGPPPPPLCKGHKEPCVLRTVKKDSLNKGRQFWVCSKPQGHSSNPDARCDFFIWVDKKKK